ncbi:MAG: phosphatase [Clostridia bacterium]|nr:phosphatase [Clostridia bacterium]
MKIFVDTHTHTNCSDHVFSSLVENLAYAKKQGLQMICMTNHAPAIPDGAHIWHFCTMEELPREVDGVRLLKGVEANVLDTEGNLDMPSHILPDMEVVIASMHPPCFPPRTREEHTKAWLNVMKNPYVHIIGHSGHPSFPYDYETVIAAARDANKCIEINNHSFAVRKGCYENCKAIAETCKKLGTKIVVSSDAHNCFQVGVFDHALKILEEIAFPEELIMNLNAERFSAYLEEFHKGRGALA